MDCNSAETLGEEAITPRGKRSCVIQTDNGLSLNDVLNVVRKIANNVAVDDSLLNDALKSRIPKIRSVAYVARMLKDRVALQQQALRQREKTIAQLEESITQKVREDELLANGPSGEVNLLEASSSEMREELRRLTREVDQLHKYRTREGESQVLALTKLDGDEPKVMTSEELQRMNLKGIETVTSCRNQALIAETQGVLEHLKRQTHQTEVFSKRLIEEERLLRTNVQVAQDLEESLSKRWRKVMLQREHDMVKYRVQQKVLQERLKNIVHEEEEERQRNYDELVALKVRLAEEKQAAVIAEQKMRAREKAELEIHFQLASDGKMNKKKEDLQCLMDTTARHIQHLEWQLENFDVDEGQSQDSTEDDIRNIQEEIRNHQNEVLQKKVGLFSRNLELKNELAKMKTDGAATSFYLLIKHVNPDEPVIPPVLLHYLASTFNVDAQDVSIGDASYLQKESVVFETMDKNSDARSQSIFSEIPGEPSAFQFSLIPTAAEDEEVAEILSRPSDRPCETFEHIIPQSACESRSSNAVSIAKTPDIVIRAESGYKSLGEEKPNASRKTDVEIDPLNLDPRGSVESTDSDESSLPELLSTDEDVVSAVSEAVCEAAEVAEEDNASLRQVSKETGDDKSLPSVKSDSDILDPVKEENPESQVKELEAPITLAVPPIAARRRSVNLTSLPADPRKLRILKPDTSPGPSAPRIIYPAHSRFSPASPKRILSARASPMQSPRRRDLGEQKTDRARAMRAFLQPDQTQDGTTALREVLQLEIPDMGQCMPSPHRLHSKESSLDDPPSECPTRRGTKSPTSPHIGKPKPPVDQPRHVGKTKTLGVPMQRRLVPSRSLVLASPTAGVHKFEIMSPRLMEPLMSPVPFGVRVAPPVSPVPNMASPMPMMSPCSALATWKREVVAAPPASPLAHEASGLEMPITTPGLVLVRITLCGIHTLAHDVADTALRDLGVTKVIWSIGSPKGEWDFTSEEFLGLRVWLFSGIKYVLSGSWCRTNQSVRLSSLSSTLYVSREELFELLGPSRLLQDDFRHLLMDRLLSFLWIEDEKLILLRLKPETEEEEEPMQPHGAIADSKDCILLEELLVVHDEVPNPAGPRFFALRVTTSRVILCEPSAHSIQEIVSIGPLGVPKLCRRECPFPKLTFLVSVEEDVVYRLHLRIRLVGRDAHPGWNWQIHPPWRMRVVLEDEARAEPNPCAYEDYEHEGTHVVYKQVPKREVWIDLRMYTLLFRCCRSICLPSPAIWIIEVLEVNAQSDLVLHCVESGTCNEAFLPVDSIELYKAFRGTRKYEPAQRFNLAVDLAQCVELYRDSEGAHIRLLRSAPQKKCEPALPIQKSFSPDECKRLLQNTENIITRNVRSISGKRCEIFVLNDPECLEALTCIHVFMIIVERDSCFYAMQMNDFSLRPILNGDQHLLLPSGRNELVEALAQWVTLRETRDGFELVVDAIPPKTTIEPCDRPLDVGSDEVSTAKWDEIKEDSDLQNVHTLHLGAMVCELIWRTVRMGYHLYFRVVARCAGVVLRIPTRGTAMPTKVYMEHLTIQAIPFMFTIWETSFPHKLTIHVMDCLTTLSDTKEICSDAVHEFCPRSYRRALCVMGDQLLNFGTCSRKPVWEETAEQAGEKSSVTVLRTNMQSTGHPDEVEPWASLYSEMHRIGAKDDAKTEPELFLNVILTKNPHARNFSLTLVVKRPGNPRQLLFGRRGGITPGANGRDGDGMARNLAGAFPRAAQPESVTIDIGGQASEPFHFFADLRTLSKVALLILVLHDSAPDALRVVLFSPQYDWTNEIHVVHHDKRLYLERSEKRSLMRQLFQDLFVCTPVKEVKLVAPQRKVLYQAKTMRGHGAGNFTMTLIQSDPIRLELTMIHPNRKKSTLLLEDALLESALRNCEVPAAHVDICGDFVGRSFLQVLTVDEAGVMHLPDVFEPIDVLNDEPP